MSAYVETRGIDGSPVSIEGSWERITDSGAGTGVTEYTESNSTGPCAGIEEINVLPGWGRDGNEDEEKTSGKAEEDAGESCGRCHLIWSLGEGGRGS